MQNPSTGHMEPIPEQQAERYRNEGRCVLAVGQEVELEGGRFRVAAMGRRFVRLEGLPGQRVNSAAAKEATTLTSVESQRFLDELARFREEMSRGARAGEPDAAMGSKG